MNLAALIMNISLAILLAPIIDGLRRKFTARLQNRIGPPILQTWYDLIKLFRKETLIAGVSSYITIFLPILTLVFSFLMFSMISTITMEAPIMINVIIFIHVVVLSAFLLALAGSVTRNPYGVLGGSRELILVALIEPSLIVSLTTLMLLRGSLYFSKIYAIPGKELPILIALLSYFLCLIAESGRIPFDLAEAEGELTGGPLIEFSGKPLAFLKLSQLIRTLALFSIVKFFIGSTFEISLDGFVYRFYIVVLYGVSMLICTLILSLSESLNTRFRLFEVSKFFGVVLSISLIALIMSFLFYRGL